MRSVLCQSVLGALCEHEHTHTLTNSKPLMDMLAQLSERLCGARVVVCVEVPARGPVCCCCCCCCCCPRVRTCVRDTLCVCVCVCV